MADQLVVVEPQENSIFLQTHRDIHHITPCSGYKIIFNKLERKEATQGIFSSTRIKGKSQGGSYLENPSTI